MKHIHRIKGSKVPPKSRAQIRKEAGLVREALKLGTRKVNMISIIEFVLPRLLSSYSYEIRTKEEMGVDEARTYPDKSLICIREDIYNEAVEGDGRAQFTLAHELGHLVMHTGLQRSVAYARNSQDHKAFEDSEWQADNFASEFLMPYQEAIFCNSAEEICKKFGVSITAARVKFKQVR